MKHTGTLKVSGWHRQKHALTSPMADFPVPLARPAWESFLGELGLDDHGAALLAAARPLGDVGSAIRAWAWRHGRRHFIPEPVLDALGLKFDAGEDVMPRGRMPANLKAAR